MIERYTDEDGVEYVSCGALQQGDYSGSSYCEANVRAVERDVADTMVTFGPHHSRQVWLPVTDDNLELVRRLEEEYPVYDEEEMSKVESEWETEAWEDYGIADLRNLYRRGWKADRGREHAPRPALADALDLIDGGMAFELYREAMEGENAYPTYEDSGAALPLGRIAAAFAGLAIEHFALTMRADALGAVLEEVASLSGGMFFADGDGADRPVAADWCEDEGFDVLAAYLRATAALETH